MKYIILKRIFFLIISLCILSFASCKKTVLVPFNEDKDHYLASFKITNLSEPISGSIDHKGNTITVVIPSGSYISAIQPELELVKECTLESGSDTLVTNLLNYFRYGRKITYPIKNKEGKVKEYKLIIKSMQPILELDEVSIDPLKPIEYNLTKWHTVKDIMINNSNKTYPYLFSNEESMKLTYAYLIDEKGKEYKILEPQTINAAMNSNSHFRIDLNKIVGRFVNNKYVEFPPAGLYWIKLGYYSKEIKLKNPIRITYTK